MKWLRFLFLLCIPSLIYSAPMQEPPKPKPSIWEFFSYDNLSYDSLMGRIESLESSDLSDLFSIDEVMHFVTTLASYGIAEWDTLSQETL